MKISSYIPILTFNILLASVTSSVLAADSPSSYVVLKGGIYSPSEKYDKENFNSGNESRLDPKSGVNGEIAFGQYLLQIVGAGYFESKASASGETGNTTLKVIPLIATGKVLIQLGPVEPYGEFGIGAYFTNLSVNDNTSSFGGSSDVTYGLHAGGGLNVNLADTSLLRYLWAKPSYGSQDVKINGITATVDLGFHF